MKKQYTIEDQHRPDKCPYCGHDVVYRHASKGTPRYRCAGCNKTFTPRRLKKFVAEKRAICPQCGSKKTQKFGFRKSWKRGKEKQKRQQWRCLECGMAGRTQFFVL